MPHLFGPRVREKGRRPSCCKKSLGLPHISTGDMLRERVASAGRVGRCRWQRLMQAGELVPDEMVNRLVEERIEQPDCENGFILDGYPRTVSQAKLLAELLVRPADSARGGTFESGL